MIFLFENSKLLFGFLPDSMAIFFFGMALISAAIAMRGFLAKVENNVFEVQEPVRNFAPANVSYDDLADAELGVSKK